MEIRRETPADIEAIHHVETLAFDRAGEADLVNALRTNGACTLSLVAEIENQIVGHVCFSPMTLQKDETNRLGFSFVALGPIGVLSQHQRRGIGSALVREGLRQLSDAGHDAVALLGNPSYYGRFGFVPARNYHLGCDYDVPAEAFQILELRPGTLKNLRLPNNCSLLFFRPEFDAVG